MRRANFARLCPDRFGALAFHHFSQFQPAFLGRILFGTDFGEGLHQGIELLGVFAVKVRVGQLGFAASDGGVEFFG